jgi:hypothetical protein
VIGQYLSNKIKNATIPEKEKILGTEQGWQ